MKTNKNTKWFTLIELIVVITILAILGTIAFISLKGYSSDAKNAKIDSDLNNISRAIDLKLVAGGELLNFVWDTSARVTGITVSGAAANVTAWTNYEAGVLNYTTLSIKQEDFLDPAGNKYLMGAKTVGGKDYELAAKKLGNESDDYAYVKGAYNPRDLTIADGTPTVADQTFTLTNNLGLFRKGDVLDFLQADGTTAGTADATVVSATATKLTLDKAIVATDVKVRLSEAESTGLIGSKADLTKPVTNGWSDLPY